MPGAVRCWCLPTEVARSRPIDAVATDRMAHLGEVDANLMRSTGFQLAFDFRVLVAVDAPEGPLGSNVSHGFLAGVFGPRATTQTIAAVANNVVTDGLMGWLPNDDRRVDADNVVRGELFDQSQLGAIVPCKDQQPAGVAINTMHGKHARAIDSLFAVNQVRDNFFQDRLSGLTRLLPVFFPIDGVGIPCAGACRRQPHRGRRDGF